MEPGVGVGPDPSDHETQRRGSVLVHKQSSTIESIGDPMTS